VRSTAAALAAVAACADPTSDVGVATCDPARPDDPPPADVGDVERLVAEVAASSYPRLRSASITVVDLDSESDFFQATLDLETADQDPLDRQYRVLANPRLFEDPPSQPAVVAILHHELGHIEDYTFLDAPELVRFGLWYATADTAAYERATDERALRAGCGDGLVEYREWLYDHVPEDVVAEKQRVYYTPDEIRAWQADHGG
jgi:hypothetical protein